MTVKLHAFANGLRLVVDPVPGVETIAFVAAVDGGARWEPEARNGWSHLLEHMVFKGAGDRSARRIAEDVEREGGWTNASTGYDRTLYQARTLRGGLRTVASVVGDMLFRPRLDPDDLEREKAVIGEEIAEAFDTPDDWVHELAQARTFADQPLGRSILGTTEVLATADRETLDAWRRRLYAPERIVVAISGAVDEDEALKAVEAAFAGEPRSGEALEPETATFIGGVDVEARRIEQANLVWRLPGAAGRDPDRAAFRLFAEMLGGGAASRLFQKAREDQGMAYAVDAWSDSWRHEGAIGVYAGTSADKAADLCGIVAAEIRDLAEHPQSAELERARIQLKAARFMAQETLPGRAEAAAGSVLSLGRVRTTSEIAEAVDAVTLDDIRRVGRRMLEPGLSAAVVLGPRRAAAGAKDFSKSLFS